MKRRITHTLSQLTMNKYMIKNDMAYIFNNSLNPIDKLCRNCLGIFVDAILTNPCEHVKGHYKKFVWIKNLFIIKCAGILQMNYIKMKIFQRKKLCDDFKAEINISKQFKTKSRRIWNNAAECKRN
jgi:hypothetical protein